MGTVSRPAQAGTLESSDMMVSVAPAAAGTGIQLDLACPTMQQFGQHITGLIRGIFAECGITDAVVQANDKGAVDWVIAARVQTAIRRATQ